MKISNINLKGTNNIIEVATLSSSILVKGSNGKYIKFNKSISAIDAISQIKRTIAQ